MRTPARHPLRRMMFAVTLAIASLAASAAGTQAASTPSTQSSGTSAESVPTLAYYYIWFDPTSWNRAKTDVPLAGKYSSDERAVMEDHVVTAKAAGMDGFIVSWKHSEKLDRRLAALAEIAEAHDFGLMVIYQGLDFEREPLPPARITSDLDLFIETFAARDAFRAFGKPAVILSGSWRFSVDEVREIGGGRRDVIDLLASEKDPEGIDRLSGLIDGNAYYWSSVNPATQPRYEERLDAMSEAVHRQGGAWIAPAAPGFDARLVGGSSVIEREEGETLRRQYAAASASDPDAIGIISWNEFSENSHIEPSVNHGTLYMQTMASLLGGRAPELIEPRSSFDSSEPGARGSGVQQLAAVAVLVATIVGAGVLISRRRRDLTVGAS